MKPEKFITTRRKLDRFDKSTLRTESIEGVSVVIGNLQSSGIDSVQSFHFPRDQWDTESAKAWADRNWDMTIQQSGVTSVIEQVDFDIRSEGVSNNTITDVKVLGLKSKNRRDYDEQAVRDAMSFYEGSPVNIDHVAPGKDASVSVRFGQLQNIAFKAGEGLRGDLVYNPHHPMAAQVKWFAENMPKAFGFSHVAECDVKQDKATGRERITKIRRVESVDLVARPATTKSLFESHEKSTAESDQADRVKKFNDIVDSKVTMAAKMQRIRQLLESNVPKPQSKGTAMTLEELKTEHPDLLKAIRESVVAELDQSAQIAKIQEQVKAVQEENKTLKAKNDELIVKESLAVRRSLVEAKIAKSKLPAPVVTDVFKESLMNAADEKAIDTLIADRETVVKASSGQPKSMGKTMGESAGNNTQDNKTTLDDLVKNLARR